MSPIGNVKKTALNAPCAEYDRDDNPDPPGCTWFDDPPKPAARRDAPGESASAPSPSSSPTGAAAAPAAPASDSLPSTGATLLPAVTGLLLAGLVLVARRRRSA